MNDTFRNYSLRTFSEVNNNVLRKMNTLESKEIEKNINSIMKIEELFSTMEVKLDASVNKIISLKINNHISSEINSIN